MDTVPTKLYLTRATGLDTELMRALGKAAELDSRDPREQAVVLMREALEHRGMLGARDVSHVTLVLSRERAEKLAAFLQAEARGARDARG